MTNRLWLIQLTKPNARYRLPGLEFKTLKEARAYLSRALKSYKDDYRRGQGVRENCRWMNKYSIGVHEIHNDGRVSGDLRIYSAYSVTLE